MLQKLILLVGLLLCAAAAPASSAQEKAAPTPAEQAYQLGAGDKLRIIVFGEANLTGEFVVSNTGDVAYPLIGQVRAAGMSVTALEQSIVTRLANGYLVSPQVSVEVLNYRPFYILGEVNRPGEYPFTNGLTVVNAVATAQGFTYRANTRRVYIKRANETTEHPESLTGPVLVQPGDTIRIAERYF